MTERPRARPMRESLGAIIRLIGLNWEVARGILIFNAVMRCGRALLPSAMLYVAKHLLDAIVDAAAAPSAQAGHAARTAFLWLAAEGLLALTSDALMRGVVVSEQRLGDRFAVVGGERLIAQMSTLDLAQMEDPEIHDLAERARQVVSGRVGLLGMLATVAQNVLTLTVLAATIGWYTPGLLLLLALSVVPAFVSETKFAVAGHRLHRRWTAERREMDYLRLVAGRPGTAKEVRLFDFGSWLVARFSRLARRVETETHRLLFRHATTAWALSTMSTASYYASYGWIVLQATSGRALRGEVITVGLLTLLAGSFRQSRDLLQSVLVSVAQLYEQTLHLSDFFGFLDLRPANSSRPVPMQVGETIAPGIVFDRVGFRYPGSAPWTLRDVTLRIAPGERIALVGENGAGKTTLAKLLAGLYRPTEGRILVNGVEAHDLRRTSRSQRVTALFQDFGRYEFTAIENIAFAAADGNDEGRSTERAVELSGLHDVVRRSPLGLNQRLGTMFSTGAELSGGEWQRVALARAYYHDADIVILDEPTAALDPRAEHDVLQRFLQATEGRMTLLISHRLGMARLANRIAVLDEGRLTELGTHEQLQAVQGRYAKFFELQSVSYR